MVHAQSRLSLVATVSTARCEQPIYMGRDTLDLLTVPLTGAASVIADSESCAVDAYWKHTAALRAAVLSPIDRLVAMQDVLEKYACVVPKATSPTPALNSKAGLAQSRRHATLRDSAARFALDAHAALHPVTSRRQLQFPDKWLVQYDCGKFQVMAQLLRERKRGGHRCLIFTQMTKMLDILEVFMNLHGMTYMRLDGSTKVWCSCMVYMVCACLWR